MEKKLGYGIVGCGVIAPFHLEGIAKTPETKLVAVCDFDSAKAKTTAEKWKVDYYTDFAEMLKRDDLDIISICTPTSLHPEQAIMAARAGKHVMTEKPMAINLEDADRMIAECRKQKVKLGCIFQRRVTEPFLSIKKALNDKELGKVLIGDIYLKYYRSQAYYDSADWRGTWEFDGGGALMNQGIHMIDLLQWYMGDIEEVSAYTGTLARKIEVEDTAVAILKFRNGALGILEGTTTVFPSIPHRLEIHGEKGSIMVEGEGVKRWSTIGSDGKPADKVTDDKTKTDQVITNPTDIAKYGHMLQIQDMVKAVLENREPSVQGDEGRKALEIILAIYESSKTGKAVRLPLKSCGVVSGNGKK